ncbi:MAG: hypothetical protein LBH49_01015 [Puniceicoccales bacterium]|jgi:hypothetical protein|nr:hypothetical protein [Puniceicoccales bacterium]
MENRFINKGMLVAVILCSVMVVFSSALGTILLRQKIFTHAGRLSNLETECRRMEDKNLSLVSKIAQMQTPNYLRIQLGCDLPIPSKEQIVRVTNWNKSSPSKASGQAMDDGNAQKPKLRAKS